MLHRSAYFVLLAALLLLAASSRAASAGEPQVFQPQVFQIPGFVYYPTIVQTAPGTESLFYVNVEPNHDNKIYVAKSTDGGRTWTDATPIHTETSPDEIVSLNATFADGETAIVFTKVPAGEKQVMAMQCDTNGGCTDPVQIGYVLGDGFPDVIAAADSCADPGVTNFQVIWSDFYEPGSPGSDNSHGYQATFAPGETPPAQPEDRGPVATAPKSVSFTTDNGVKLSARIFVEGQQIITTYDGIGSSSYNVPYKVRRAWVKALPHGDVAYYWQSDEVPPRIFEVTAHVSANDPCADPEFTPSDQIQEINPIFSPVGGISFDGGPGEITQPRSAAAGAGQPIMVFSWVEACCQGMFHVLNTVSTDGGETWSDAKEIAPPSQAAYLPNVAVLGDTIWNVFGSFHDGTKSDIQVAASTDGGATYKNFSLTNDGASSLARVYFLSSEASHYARTTALSDPPAVSPPIMITFNRSSSGNSYAGVGPFSLAGDASCDNLIGGSDVVATLGAIAGGQAAPCPTGADVNCDSLIDVADALSELDFLAGLPENVAGSCPPIGY